MDERTEQALRESIDKWQALAITATLDGVKIGAKCSPLCQIHNNWWSGGRGKGCSDCPVYEKTGQTYCLGTPHTEARDAFFNSDLPAFLDAARREVDFLKSLLPEAQP